MNNIKATNTNNMTEKENATMTTKTYNKAVICNETNEFFFSMSAAAKMANCSIETIRHIIEGKTKKSRCGFTFRYATAEEIASVEKEIIIQQKSVVKGKGKRGNRNTNAVLCLSTGKVYTSCLDAAEDNNSTQGHMSYVCNHKGRTAKGKKFCYVKDINEHLDEVANAIYKANMYDDMMTKEEKRNELLTNLKNLEAKADSITSEIIRLNEELENAEREIKKAQRELIYFGI